MSRYNVGYGGGFAVALPGGRQELPDVTGPDFLEDSFFAGLRRANDAAMDAVPAVEKTWEVYDVVDIQLDLEDVVAAPDSVQPGFVEIDLSFPSDVPPGSFEVKKEPAPRVHKSWPVGSGQVLPELLRPLLDELHADPLQERLRKQEPLRNQERLQERLREHQDWREYVRRPSCGGSPG